MLLGCLEACYLTCKYCDAPHAPAQSVLCAWCCWWWWWRSNHPNISRMPKPISVKVAALSWLHWRATRSTAVGFVIVLQLPCLPPCLFTHYSMATSMILPIHSFAHCNSIQCTSNGCSALNCTFPLPSFYGLSPTHCGVSLETRALMWS